jgi:hypothetical protein
MIKRAKSLYKNNPDKWAGADPTFCPKLVRGWFRGDRHAGFVHDLAIRTARETALSISELWIEGRIPAKGGGAAILCNKCSSGAVQPEQRENHAVVVAYTEDSIWIFNSQIFHSIHSQTTDESGVPKAPIAKFANIQLVKDVMYADTRQHQRPWYHVPNDSGPCLRRAMETFTELAKRSPAEWAQACVERAKAHVASLPPGHPFETDHQRIYRLRL